MSSNERRAVANHMRRCTRVGGLLLVGCQIGCHSGPRLQTPPAPAVPAAAVMATVYLIGDAGAARPNDQVLAALGSELRRRAGDVTVLFMGDNVYPKGIPAPEHADRAEAERRLRVQVDALRGTDARGVFIPGNHDWARSGEEGWASIVRFDSLLARENLARVSLLPTGGCPGPEVITITERFRLVVLDTQWWLHPHDRPEHPTSRCAADSMGEVASAIRNLAIGSATIGVVGHHPLATGGVHGGHFGVLDHVFPLRALEPWLWVPLPIIGSAYPVARMAGISDQDLSGDGYRVLADSLRAAFAGADVLFYAGGHEHNLQVIADSTFGHVLVSGAGYFAHTTRVVYLDDSRYAAAVSGYMRLQLLRDGRARLAVVEVAETGETTEAFTMWLGEVHDG